MLEKLKIIGITAIICIVGTFIITKLYFPSVEFEITDSHVGETTHQIPTNNIDVNKPEDCIIAKNCANSDIKIKARIEKNKLLGRAYDLCKSVEFEYEFKGNLIPRYIIQIGAGWTYDIGYYIRPGYLYQFDFIAIGGSCILPKDKKHFGIEFMVQKAFGN